MKKCFKCGKKKVLTEFYKHRMMADGHLNKCKECTKSDVRRNYSENIEKYSEYERERAMLPHRVAARKRYAGSPRGKEVISRIQKQWIKKNLLKRAAHIIVGNAVARGKLNKEPCEKCGSKTRIHGHHDNYSKPLEVRWLCAKHHNELHKRKQ